MSDVTNDVVQKEEESSEETIDESAAALEETDDPIEDVGETVDEDEGPEPIFEVGDVVVVRESFHSQYFRLMTGVIQSRSENSGTDHTLWIVKIDAKPNRLIIPAKYLQLKSEADAEAAAKPKSASVNGSDASNSKSKGSFFTRFIPWKR